MKNRKLLIPVIIILIVIAALIVVKLINDNSAGEDANPGDLASVTSTGQTTESSGDLQPSSTAAPTMTVTVGPEATQETTTPTVTPTADGNQEVGTSPKADFTWSPETPTNFDVAPFCDNSSDPAGKEFTTFAWDFGDGTTASGKCVDHKFTQDKDFNVKHTVTTSDGRSAAVTKTVSVRTHDVSISKFLAPQAANVGNTRQLIVGVRNHRYPESVTVTLQKVTQNGYESVDSLSQQVPVQPGSQTTDFTFNYTFTQADAAKGKLTFQAVAVINTATDANTADNTARSHEIIVHNKQETPTPYKASVDSPGTVQSALTFGILGLGLVGGFWMVAGPGPKRSSRKDHQD